MKSVYLLEGSLSTETLIFSRENRSGEKTHADRSLWVAAGWPVMEFPAKPPHNAVTSANRRQNSNLDGPLRTPLPRSLKLSGAKLAPAALAEVFDQHQIAALMVDLRPEHIVAV